MNLKPLLKFWKNDGNFNHIKENLFSSQQYRALITGLEGSQRNFFWSSLIAESRKTTLIITSNSMRAEKIYEDLLSFWGEDELHLLPNRDLVAGEETYGYSRETWEQRMEALELMSHQNQRIFIAPVNALLFRMMPYSQWQEHIIPVEQGQELYRDLFLENLVSMGYERVPLIEGKGQFSVRGDILDVFPPGWENPVRIELFDNMVESLRIFDCNTQRSLQYLSRVEIFPAGEVLLPPELRKKAFALIEEELAKTTTKLNQNHREETATTLKEKVYHHMEIMKNSILQESMYPYFTYFYEEGDSWLDYLPDDSMVIVDEPARTKEAAETFADRARDLQKDHLLQGKTISSNMGMVWELEEMLARLSSPLLYFALFNVSGLKVPRNHTLNFSGKDVPTYYGQWRLLRSEIERWREEGYRIFILSPEENQAEALFKHLRDQDFTIKKMLDPGQLENVYDGGNAVLTVGNLHNGFYIPSIRVAVVTEQELLPKKKKKKRISRSKEGKTLRHHQELSVGDYVVHEHHGIGQYLGVQTLEVENTKRDYLHIRYAKGDKLFVPIDQIELIQRYIGVEGKTPKLHRLGSDEWNRAKKKVRASVQELAQDLLSIYSSRESIQGHAFSMENPWQTEFESFFPYEETPDQLQAIQEVRKDLAQSKPMDRLLCGDVGYGKTEVAMRAAFDVVMEGKQVAVLAPTTVLAQQHYRNFIERFAPFPVEISLLSRFRSTAQQKETLEKLSEGKVDILIGTHRLLSNDVNFKDLGLIIIDEEHRFGVRHKEKLKKMRLDVDVLTLTATPIPRTLHMSLVGARDLSLIETPPENRYPVQTYVLEYSDQVVKEAITRELERHGQVYYVFNRVQNIEKWAQKVRDLVPQARIAVAHGQMSETRLEKVMHAFWEGQYDVLLSTTIIEAGLDIPNVNTLIIYDADRFGLAQLYQLRGRVGRSNRLAYAYLTFQKEKILSEAAEKRLQAIKEFAELGSGFKIALRDLEIRGAGNILGPEQHGFMAEVGFELYCQMLEEAVRAYRGEKTAPETITSPRLDLKISAYLPSSYIPDQEQKVDLYQRIYALDSPEKVEEIEAELVDRFGTLPLEVENLLMIARLRILASELRITSIHYEKGEVYLKFDSDQEVDTLKLYRLVKQYPGKMSLQTGKGVTLKIKPHKEKVNLAELEQFLNKAREVVI